MTTTNSKKESLGGELTTVKQQLQDKDGVSFTNKNIDLEIINQ